MYRTRTNIGKELNLAIWRITTESPNLNLTNIILFTSVAAAVLQVFSNSVQSLANT